MRTWGTIITAFYSVTLVFFLTPTIFYFLFDIPYLHYFRINYLHYLITCVPEYLGISLVAVGVWGWIAILVGGQALLLFLSTGSSWRRNKPRQHILLTSMVAGMLIGLLVYFFLISLGSLDIFIIKLEDEDINIMLFLSMIMPVELLDSFSIVVWWLGFGLLWSTIFYSYNHTSEVIVSRAIFWLRAASIIVLPVTVLAYTFFHRDDLFYFEISFIIWGIVTGIAVMLLSFGPGVLALYKKRIDGYNAKCSDSNQECRNK